MYVVRCSDGSFYTGITTDLTRRLHEHNNTSRGAKYTRSRRPVEIVYCIEFDDRSSASKAEYRFKKLTRKQKEEKITLLTDDDLEQVCGGMSNEIFGVWRANLINSIG